MSRPSEDELIARYFAPLATAPGADGLTDDAAVLPAGAGDLVVTKDMLVAGVHFFPDDPPDLVARKALRVNLSDLAAKGARPAGFLLALGLPADWTEAFLEAFTRGLATDIERFGCPLYGGDTVKMPGPVTRPGPLTLSVTAFGRTGRTVRRNGAEPGDLIVVSGTIGDGALGLKARLAEREPSLQPDWLKLLAPEHRAALAGRYLLPEPRTGLADAVSAHASAAMDISDGLAGDLAKLMKVSGVAGQVRLADIPVSAAVRAARDLDTSLVTTMLTGGDDYEILATVPPGALAAFEAAGRAAGVAVAVIGQVTAGDGLAIIDAAGQPLSLGAGRFEHF
ncbi:thiamine-phosphate kinase [Phreatobacter stygius]|uniref:Thiamine-monophosphate kinase n=1 Tax=Phreatobacter stygius TaxID=1940610 RepID=A0A4D7BAC8_9HYPH|nr:thiamine-phosphate kinase [Phreatobacter stygius]QCI67580.1 thiamine-phosphate kinase [Phreatobacter stygius]